MPEAKEGAATEPAKRRQAAKTPDTGALDLERERLRFEMRRFAIEVKLKRAELRKPRPSGLQLLLSNPLTIAIVGGIVTLLAQVIVSGISANNQISAERTKAELQRGADALALQADLIKKFAEAPDLQTAKGNLLFLADAGLLPDFEEQIRSYLGNEDNPIPILGAVVGPDDRIAFRNLSAEEKQIFGSIGQITMRYADRGEVACTGFFIAPRVVATFSHCVIPLSVEGASQGAAFQYALPQPDGLTERRLDLASQRTFPINDRMGVTLVKLSEGEAESRSVSPVAAEPPSLATRFFLAFYAGDTGEFMASQASDCGIAHLFENRLTHVCDTAPGSAGAPLLLPSGAAIAMHYGRSSDLPLEKEALRLDALARDPAVLQAFGDLTQR